MWMVTSEPGSSAAIWSEIRSVKSCEAFTDVVLRADGRLRPAVHLFIEGQDDESLGLDAQLPGDYVVMMVEVFPIQGG